MTSNEILASIKTWFNNLDPSTKRVVKYTVIGGWIWALLPMVSLTFGAIVGGAAGSKMIRNATAKAVKWIKSQK